jgi:hypothetical protein
MDQYKFNFLVIFDLKSLFGEYSFSEKSLKKIAISTNFGPKSKNFESLVLYPR